MSQNLRNTIIDNINDSIGTHLRTLQAIRTWTGEKAQLFKAVERLATTQRYLRFTGDFRDYPIEHKGQSCLYDVPSTQRGATGHVASRWVPPSRNVVSRSFSIDSPDRTQATLTLSNTRSRVHRTKTDAPPRPGRGASRAE